MSVILKIAYQLDIYRGKKFKLWELHTKYLRLEKYIENVVIVRRPNEFRSRYEYWLLDENGNVRRMKKNLKSLLKTFPEHAADIKRIVRLERVDIKTVEKLSELVQRLEKC